MPIVVAGKRRSTVLSEAARLMGRKGGTARMKALTPAERTRLGQKGGKARARVLSPEARRAIGVKGGRARTRALTPEKRRAIASKAGKAGAAARWGKGRPPDLVLPLVAEPVAPYTGSGTRRRRRRGAGEA